MSNEIKKLIFWGGTGQSIVLEEFLTSENYELVAIIDNNPDCISPFTGIPVYTGLEGLDNLMKQFQDENLHYLVAIGGKYGKDRYEIHQTLKKKGLVPINAVHPNAYVAKNAAVGAYNQILAGATIGARVKTGDVCIINTSASVDHECILGDGVHIGPGAHLAGCIEVGDYTFIGTGATILPRIKIGKNVIIGAGAIVTKDIPDNVIAYGNPCRIIKNNQ